METAADSYLATVRARLAADGFAWEENVAWKGSVFRAVASRSRFAPSRLGFEDRWFLFGEYPEVDKGTLASYEKACFGYATRHRLKLLPRGLGRWVTCFSVVVAGAVDPAAVEAVRRKRPGKLWSATVFRAIYDRSTGALHIYEKTPQWGVLFWRGLRNTAREVLGPPDPAQSPPT